MERRQSNISGISGEGCLSFLVILWRARSSTAALGGENRKGPDSGRLRRTDELIVEVLV